MDGSSQTVERLSSSRTSIVGDCGTSLQWGSPFPDYDPSDEGKVLMINNSSPEWADFLPTYDTTDDAGKVLTVTSSGLRWNSLS